MNYAKYIDHTILKADATEKQIEKLVKEAKKWKFKTICVNASNIENVKKFTSDSNIEITAVIGFPLGASTTETKIFEAKDAANKGANEIDMVMNIGFFKDKKYQYIKNEINQIKLAIGKKCLKVIVETALLTNEEIKIISKLVKETNADFIKTSTGFSSRGASFLDVETMNSIIKGKIGIKAAGGVKSISDLKKMIELGATRIGTSSGVKIMQSISENEGDYYD